MAEGEKMQERHLVLQDIGNVRLVKSKRAKRVSITIKPFEGVRVSIPHRVSYREAERIVQKRAKWIHSHLPRIATVERQRTLFDESTAFATKERTLRVVGGEADSTVIRVFPGLIEVRYPSRMDVYEDEVQNAIRKGIEEAWRMEAKKFLVDRLHELSQTYRLPFHRVFIKNNKTRWGSCSHRNNINLSLHLMRIPDRLADYVLLHELAHTVVKNHSPKFWSLLDRICPHARQLDREMNRWSLTIY